MPDSFSVRTKQRTPALVPDLEQRLRSAFHSFTSDATTEEHSLMVTALKALHYKAKDALGGASVSHGGIEFAHAAHCLGLLPEEEAPLLAQGEKFESRVEKNGEILGFGKWELLDPSWTEALIEWFEHLHDRAPFGTDPAHIAIPAETRIVIAGDWGTGPWRDGAPSTKVGRSIKSLGADYTIHLGDVYYAGKAEEEQANLVEPWPRGKLGSLTLNSNHEMYSGALPYFQQALPAFGLQQGCSYFSLENEHWLIIGIDSAYDASPFELYLKGKIGERQQQWLRALPKNKKVVLLSHHEGFDQEAKKTTELFDQVVDALGKAPEYWYWGHLHNAIVYSEQKGMKGRCVGHGAIPYGNASELKGDARVAWYESQSAMDPEIPSRVLNGFAHVELSDNAITEKLLDENGSERWSSS